MNRKILNGLLVVLLLGVWFLIGYQYTGLDTDDGNIELIDFNAGKSDGSYYLDSLSLIDPFVLPHKKMLKPVKNVIQKAAPVVTSFEQPITYFLSGSTILKNVEYFLITSESGETYHLTIGDTLNNHLVLLDFKQDTLWIRESRNGSKQKTFITSRQ